MAIEELLGTIDRIEFFANYWDKSPVVIRGSSQHLNNLLTIDGVERKLTETDLRFPQFQLAMKERKLSKTDYTRRRVFGNHHFDDLIDIPAVYGLWNSGATIILQSLQTNYPELIPFLRELERELNHPVQANAYLSPMNSQGFKPHYDTHDVFAIQLHGRKRWHIWKEPAVFQPLKDEHSPRDIQPKGELFFDDIVNPGDVIYIPRGYYHEAVAESTTSLHITIGVLVYRRIDALRFLFDFVLNNLREGDNLAWREALSISEGQESDDIYLSLRDDVFRMLSENWGVDVVKQRFLETLWPVNQRLFSVGSLIDELDDFSILSLNANMKPTITHTKDVIRLVYGGRTLTLPISTRNAIEEIIGQETFSPADLSEYDIKSRVELCKHLVRQGLLTQNAPIN